MQSEVEGRGISEGRSEHVDNNVIIKDLKRKRNQEKEKKKREIYEFEKDTRIIK